MRKAHLIRQNEEQRHTSPSLGRGAQPSRCGLQAHTHLGGPERAGGGLFLREPAWPLPPPFGFFRPSSSLTGEWGVACPCQDPNPFPRGVRRRQRDVEHKTASVSPSFCLFFCYLDGLNGQAEMLILTPSPRPERSLAVCACGPYCTLDFQGVETPY